MNKMIFMGRLTADPEIRNGNDGTSTIAYFNLAVDKRFRKKDDPNASTADFFRIVAFNKLGEFVEKWLKKGTKVVVEGRIENNNYETKDGQKVYGFSFIAENIEFAESKKASDDNGGNNTSFVDVPEGVENDLPFK